MEAIMRLGRIAFAPSFQAGALTLAGCGTTMGDRGLSVAMLGAGMGAAIGSLAGSAGTGALIGGLGAVALGVMTSPDALNLGEPPWHHTAAESHRTHRVARNDEKCTTRDTPMQHITTCDKTK
jgi:osmotically inducible lipoprotein OsmB